MASNLSDSPVLYGAIIALLWIGSWFYIPGAESVFIYLDIEQNWHSWSVFYIYYSHLAISIAILAILVASRTHYTVIFGKGIRNAEIPAALKLTAFLYLFSVAAAYAFYIPLSYVTPEFVQWWYLDVSPLIFNEEDSYPVLANILGFASLVAVGPVIEEVLFRGMLLRIWVKRWGLVRSAVLSSLLFGVLHADPIGAFAFGIGMSILYLRTQSLYLPILCHAVNNLVAWLFEAGYIFHYGPNYEYTIDTLRSEWYVGIICLVIAALWIAWYLMRPVHSREWKLPAT